MHQYPPDYVAGTELYTETLAAIQAAAGHHVAVFCPAPRLGDGGVPTAVIENGVRIYRIPIGPRSRSQVFRDTFRQRQLREAWQLVLRQEAPDLVHVQHLMGMPVGLVDPLLEAGIPYVVTLHDYWYFCANAQLLTNTDQTICAGPDQRALNCAQCALARSGREKIMGLAPAIAPLMRYRNAKLQAVLQKARYAIAPTDFVRQTSIDLGARSENVVLIRHGISLPDEKLVAANRRQAASRQDKAFHVGYIGSIGWQKGVHILIEAVNMLPPGRLRLTIYGDLTTFPDYVTQLQGMIQGPEVRLAGPVSRENLWTTLAGLDLVVLPTLWYETSSLVLDEAFAAGVPVVVSDIGVMSEKVEDNMNGRLFSPGDATALQQILSEIEEDPGLLDRWGEGIPAVQTIAEHVKEIEELYQSTLDTV